MQGYWFVFGMLFLGACTDVDKAPSVKPVGDVHLTTDMSGPDSATIQPDVGPAADAEVYSGADTVAVDTTVVQPDVQQVQNCVLDKDCLAGNFCDQQAHICKPILMCGTNADCVQPSPAVGCSKGDRVLFYAVCTSGKCEQSSSTLEDCKYDCKDNVCLQPQCTVDTDCGSGVTEYYCDGSESVGGYMLCLAGSCKVHTLPPEPCADGCDLSTGLCVTTTPECTSDNSCNGKYDAQVCEGSDAVTYSTVCTSGTCEADETDRVSCTNGCVSGACAAQAMVSCATELNPGVLFRGQSSSATYYCGGDGKKYLFPNDLTYQSWYTSYSGIMQIADALLAKFADGGNVRIRPGTWLVKITSNPSVYAVEPCGKLRKIPSEAVAVSLYGATWNVTRVVDVPDAIWGDYWDSGVEVSALNPPNRYLRNNPAKGQYEVVLEDGYVHPLTTEGFADNHFQTKFASTLPTGITYTEGDSINGFDNSIFDPAKIGCN